MPLNLKDDIALGLPRRTRSLQMPGIGMESEFNVWLDEVEIDPKAYFQHPSAFIDRPLLPREKSSLQLPTGGAVYFDRGVIEVVTPVIELAVIAVAYFGSVIFLTRLGGRLVYTGITAPSDAGCFVT